MDQFVCVRLVQANRLDLTQFQFDYDLTFAVFFMNPDGTIYGRYGTRSSQQDADRELSNSGFSQALKGALALHKDYPDNKPLLAGKQPKPTRYKSPDDFPSLKGKYKAEIDYKNNTARSCLHCHQVNDAARAAYQEAGKPIPDETLFIYPMPKVVGLALDPTTRSTVVAVAKESAAAKAGFRKGDELETLDGQPVLSIADVQWVLHHTGDPDQIPAQVTRSGKTLNLSLRLDPGWRRHTDISWRVSSWPLRRMVTGGLVFEELNRAQRSKAKLNSGRLALRVKHVGQYGAHAAGKRAGFRKEDIVVSFNGHDKRMSESLLLALTVQTTKPGQRIPVTVLRDGRRIQLMLPIQR